ncbi:MAG: hypothetical protein A2622_12625 [Bdellovibrionales bacterium RIFCSPHIGHO2_01_FULL_40_29]|nr:MAG: hypothetical protein A2622_12625 [Bdellovibrionales bacterium RIFCSPHIGHO2_01_FULL_40_29]OFZ33461.1 MAG: hypothetical protein A3D17_14260 [Bdellovibrionales bacterium RIFCSPHIGHO2_02_FULL_40_15]
MMDASLDSCNQLWLVRYFKTSGKSVKSKFENSWAIFGQISKFCINFRSNNSYNINIWLNGDNYINFRYKDL